MSAPDRSYEDLPPGTPVPGETLDGKCRIDGVLGVGGMGVVLSATHLHLDQKVAVKIMLPELARNQEVVARFVREGRAAVRIKSAHVARVYDVSTRPSGEPYMIMELLRGSDLGRVLSIKGKLEARDAADYVLQACDALAEAHAKGIVHRDLKPSNLFLAQEEDGSMVLKVLDFGVSKLAQEDGSDGMSITKSRSMLGSPLYMSPEQLTAARNVDGRTDVWSLGVILFELLSGKPPFDASTIAQLGAMVLAGPIPDLAKVEPTVPADLARIVARCMSRERDARYASVLELATALAPFASDRRRAAVDELVRRWKETPPISSPDIAAHTDIASAPTLELSASQIGTRTGGVWSTSAGTSAKARTRLAVVAGIAIAIFVGILALRQSGSSRASATTAPSNGSSTKVAATNEAPAATASTIEPVPITPVAPSATPPTTDPTPTEPQAAAPTKPPPKTAKPGGTKPKPTPNPVPSGAAPPPKSDRFD